MREFDLPLRSPPKIRPRSSILLYDFARRGLMNICGDRKSPQAPTNQTVVAAWDRTINNGILT